MLYIKPKTILVLLQIPLLTFYMHWASAGNRPYFCDEAAYVENGYLWISGNAEAPDETDARLKAFEGAKKEAINYFNGESRVKEIESVRTHTEKYKNVYFVCRLCKVKLIQKDREKVVRTDTGKIIEIRDYAEIEVEKVEINNKNHIPLIITTEPSDADIILEKEEDGGWLNIGRSNGDPLTGRIGIPGTLIVDKEGYKKIRVPDIELRNDKTLKMHFKLTPIK